VSQPARHLFTFQDYVLLEDMSTVRHEFLDGEVWAMAGGTPDHSRVCVNVQSLLSETLRGKRCAVFNTDLRIRVGKTGLGTYPDASVICGRVELDPEDMKKHTALNPTLIVEVLSPSTESYDRGEKLGHYKQIDSVREVMLVAHDERRVDLWRRTETGWTQLTFPEGTSVALTSLACELPVDEIYRDPLA
jgi:Uma2 family endonuclease